MLETCDVLVLGVGSGSENVANELATAGLHVVAVEKELVGGECPYWACVPSKMALRSAELIGEVEKADARSGPSRVTPNWSLVAERIRAEATTNWNDADAVEQLQENGVELVRGEGRLVSSRAVEVAGRTIEATRAVVIGTGTRTAVPAIDGLAGTPFWTNRDAVAATAVPESLVVVGGGPVGCEFAQIFSRFGSTVTIVETDGGLLPGLEPQAGRMLAQAFRDEGIQVLVKTEVSSIQHSPAGFKIEIGNRSLDSENVLIATGRTADLKAIGAIDQLRIDPRSESLPVDERCRVMDGVYGVGDITGVAPFTHTAAYQADIIVRDILGTDPYDADYTAMPQTVFTDPEVAMVGMTEQQARDADRDVVVGISDLGARGWLNATEGLIKTVVDRTSDRLLGATCVGPVAGETVAALQVALRAGVTTRELRRTIWAYPTFAHAIPDALPDETGAAH